MMPIPDATGPATLREDARKIWNAAIEAVRPERLVAARLAVESGMITFDGRSLEPPVRLAEIDRILVVGGGKAAAGLAAALDRLLRDDRPPDRRPRGLVSVPEGVGRDLSPIEVRETRPAAANLPTPRVVEATREILALVAAAGPRDLVIAVITGGGSALLAAPREGVRLEEKIATTRRLSESGATIAELNEVRKRLSLVKGGGLARACRAGRLVAVVLSDVIGDDLEVIASGPCMPGDGSSPSGNWTTSGGCIVSHLLIGDNATAVRAAAAAARSLGYQVEEVLATAAHEPAEATGRRLASDGIAVAERTRNRGRPSAIIEGGETTVTVPTDHGIGGRNQQTVLAAVDGVLRTRAEWPAGLLVASIGTDGEDGPTDAAGGFADAGIEKAIRQRGLDVSTALARCDAHPLLAAAGGLIRTGPTGTNVADIRIVLAR